MILTVKGGRKMTVVAWTIKHQFEFVPPPSAMKTSKYTVYTSALERAVERQVHNRYGIDYQAYPVEHEVLGNKDSGYIVKVTVYEDF